MAKPSVFRLLMCVLCVQKLGASKCLEDVDDSELLMTFLVHRHGDRTPYPDEDRFSNEPRLLVKLAKPYGDCGLIESGKARSFQLGKFLRKRYNCILAPNMSDVLVQCTEFKRTIMTANIAMTAAYSPEEKWREGMELMPLVCNVVPAQSDYYLMPEESCPKFAKYFRTTSAKHPGCISRFGRVMDKLAPVLGTNLTLFDLTQLPGLFITQEELGIPVSPEIKAIIPAIEEASDMAFNELFGNKDYINFEAGLLIKDFVQRAEDVIAGKTVPKFRVFSAHDFNVYMLLEAIRAGTRTQGAQGARGAQGAPRYCAACALELRRAPRTGHIAVLAVYKGDPGEPVKFLQMEGCTRKLCDFNIFKRSTSKYALNLHEFEQKCGMV